MTDNPTGQDSVTKAMLEAGCKAFHEQHRDSCYPDPMPFEARRAALTIYRAMSQASPPPQTKGHVGSYDDPATCYNCRQTIATAPAICGASPPPLSDEVERLKDLPRLIELQRTAAPDCPSDEGWNAGLVRAAEMLREILTACRMGGDK